MKYQETVERFLKYLESIDRASETINGYRKELGYFAGFLDRCYGMERNMNEVTLEDMEAYMYEMKQKGMMDTTRNRVIYILRSFYKYAYKRGYCLKNLPVDLEPIKVKKRERTFLDEVQINDLFQNIDKPILKSAIQTMYYTGIRVSELTNLELKDLDMEERLIYVVNGKGKKDRVIPVGQKLYDILLEYIKDVRPDIDSDKLFCTKKSGALSSQYINLTLRKAQKSMGLEKRVSAHILRHSFASNLIKANVPLPYLQRLLGHADLRVTSLYIHQSIDELRKAVELV